MYISQTAILLTALCVPSMVYAGQAATGSAPAQSTTTSSSLLKPAMDTLLQSVGAVKLEKWKGGAVRTEAGTNIASIQKDLQTTLPGLLKDADAAPESISRVLPVSRNVDALYDVVLRVVDGAGVAAPADQLAQLQQAMASLNKARHALDDRIAEMAAAQEKQVGDLRVALKAQAAPVVPVAAPVCPTVTTPKKKVVKKKPAAPATAPTTNAQPNGAAKPN